MEEKAIYLLKFIVFNRISYCMKFFDYSKHAKTYSKLDISGTYFLAYRDLPEIISKYAKGKKALDYGCGTGRSTRFLKNLGFNTTGVDISKKMIEEAKKEDPEGDYHEIDSGNLALFEANSFDLILSAFVFDSIFSKEEMVKISKELNKVLKGNGILINITSTPEIYQNDWVSFKGKFPENQSVKSGDKVKVVIRESGIDITDYLWLDEDYRDVFKRGDFRIVETFKPLAKREEKNKWKNETKIAPWLIYILEKK
jgi:ubiquinone/menaquinone biosynthesis C-methylase UbiE